MQKPVEVQAHSPEINSYNDPLEAFDAQVRFAQKWAQITGADFASILYAKTTLYNKVTTELPDADEAPDSWRQLVGEFGPESNPDAISKMLYGIYKETPKSRYKPGAHNNALGFNYIPEKKAIKIHFTNPVRGERPLADENMPKRQEEFRAMLEHVKAEYPEAALLISGTWLRSTSHYRDLSPPNIAPERSLMSPDMKMTGNSVWGQFIDASGHINRRVYDQFVAAVDTATTIEELLEAFPYKTMLSEDTIDKYYAHYGLEAGSSELENEPALSFDQLDDYEAWAQQHWIHSPGTLEAQLHARRKLREETQELLEALAQGTPDDIISEDGDVLWSAFAASSNAGILPGGTIRDAFPAYFKPGESIKTAEVDRIAMMIFDGTKEADIADYLKHADYAIGKKAKQWFALRETVNTPEKTFADAWINRKRAYAANELVTVVLLSSYIAQHYAGTGLHAVLETNYHKIQGRIARSEAVTKPPRDVNMQ